MVTVPACGDVLRPPAKHCTIKPSSVSVTVARALDDTTDPVLSLTSVRVNGLQAASVGGTWMMSLTQSSGPLNIHRVCSPAVLPWIQVMVMVSPGHTVSTPSTSVSGIVVIEESFEELNTLINL